MKVLSVIMSIVFSVSSYAMAMQKGDDKKGADGKDDCFGKTIDRLVGNANCGEKAEAPKQDEVKPVVMKPVEIKAEEPKEDCKPVEKKEKKESNCPKCKKCNPKVVTKEVVKKQVVYKDKVVTRTVTVEVPKKNQLYLLIGNGPNGMNYEMRGGDGRDIQLRLEKGLLIGIGYDRMVTDSIVVGAGVLTNETILGKLGFVW